MTDPADPPKSTSVCVVGMHRSGTSLLTSVLEELGVFLGASDELHTSSPDNRLGHFELRNIVQLNDRLLERYSGAWDVPPRLPEAPEQDPWLTSWRTDAKAFLDEVFGGRELWGLKDPRLSLTLPFWRELLPSPRYIVCVRNPLAVAHSLRERNGFPLEKSLALWRTYTAAALRYTVGHKRLVLCLGTSPQLWAAQVRHVAEFISDLRPLEAELLERAPGRFVAGDWHHRVTTEDGLSAESASLEMSVYLALVAVATSADAPSERDRALQQLCDTALPQLVGYYDRALAMLSDAQAQQARLVATEAELTTAQAMLVARDEAARHAASEREQLASQLTAETALRAQLASQLTAETAERQRLDGVAREQHLQLRATADATLAYFHKLHVSLTELESGTGWKLWVGLRRFRRFVIGGTNTERRQFAAWLSGAVVNRLRRRPNANPFAGDFATPRPPLELRAALEPLRTPTTEAPVEPPLALLESTPAERPERQAFVGSRSYRLLRWSYHRLAFSPARKEAARRRFYRLFPRFEASRPDELPGASTWDCGATFASAADAPWVLPEAAGPDAVFWGVIDWHFRTQRPQHLARGMAAAGRRVFYVSVDFIDSPEPGFRVEALDKEHTLFQVRFHVAGSPQIYVGAATAEVQRQLTASVASFLAWTNSGRLINIVQHPYWIDMVERLPNSHIVYDCMDFHCGFDGTATATHDLELRLLRRADLTVVTSKSLLDYAKSITTNVALIPNAGDYDYFSKAPSEVYRDPQGRPVIGYYGAIAEWFDVELVRKVAQALPQCAFLLVGHDSCGAQLALADCPNVQFTGEVPYRDLTRYLYAFEACLIPFRLTPLTNATNPVKFFEYLSAGKPVISVDLPELRPYPEQVTLASTHEAFVAAVRAILAQPPATSQRAAWRKFASRQTWAHRVTTLERHIAAMSEPRATVIVVTYNNLELTRACLRSLETHTDYKNLEVIIVDNASSDGTPSFLRKHCASRPGWRAILNRDNLGFAAANNQGLAAASGEYLVLLNNDTVVTQGWLRTLIAHQRRRPELGLVGPVTNNIGNEARVPVQYQTPDEMHGAARAFTLSRMGQHFDLRTAAFFCVMMPRAVYERVGPLDESFGVGFFEDDDYCRRVEKAGFAIACADDVFIHHHLSASFNQLKLEKRQALFERNKKIYEQKWGTWTPHQYR